MAGLSATLEMCRCTLLNTQIQIQTTSNNISNADNETYARQTVVMGSNAALFGTGGWIGTGASILEITQNRDTLVEQRLFQAISGETGQTTLYDLLSQAQNILSDDGTTGLSSLLGDFWDSWDSLAQNASGSSEQQEVLSATESLANAITSAYEQLQSLKDSDIPESISDDTERINTLLSQVAELNQQIVTNEASGYSANDLRDARYAAVSELAELIPVQYTEQDDGSITLTLSYGDTSSATLVEGSTYGEVEYDSSTSGLTVTQADGSSVSVAADEMTDGSLGGELAAITDIDSYMSYLDDFAASLISEVNSIHGTAVFSGSGAADIASTETFLDSIDVSTETGIATSMSALQDESVTIGSGTETLGDYIANLQQVVGTDQQNASDLADIQAALRETLETQQQSVSGVSVDEELVNLITYQQIYQAAAKLISQTADMMQTVIDMV